MIKIGRKLRRQLMDVLVEFNAKYWDEVPIEGIRKEFESYGVEMIEHPPKNGEVRTIFDLKQGDEWLCNTVLWISFYKMPSGRYEIVAYIS